MKCFKTKYLVLKSLVCKRPTINIAFYKGWATEQPSLLREHFKWLTRRLVYCDF